MDQQQKTIVFESWHSLVDPEFWSELSRRKLTEYRLDKSERSIFAMYTTGGNHVSLSSRISVNGDSFSPVSSTKENQPSNLNNNRYTNIAPGFLYNMNTMDEFKDLDKKKLLRDTCIHILRDVVIGKWLENPSILTTFCLLSFADLKNHTFYYWFAFPSVIPMKSILNKEPVVSVLHLFENAMDSLTKSYLLYQTEATLENKGFFFVSISKHESNDIQFHPLSKHKSLFADSERYVMLGFNDSSALADNPNIILKNYLLAAVLTFKQSEFKVLCLREVKGGERVDLSRSIIIHAQMDIDHMIPEQVLNVLSKEDITEQDVESVSALVKVSGWEKNTKGKTAPRYVDVSSMMDPMKLAASSVSLNLELMKWRMFPDLNLTMLSEIKSLLIGSGTLGCHVARNLMAWGMFNITMVDRSKVSYSNPVRQPLYEYEDCLNGGRDKAQCAAEKLKKIYPLANVAAESLEIPMPGHVVTDSEVENAKRNVERLEALIDEHDVIFLLTDTRESRWLPSVIGAKKQKIIINAALGYESYVVMRHGVLSNDNSVSYRLGCYFCNDVVAPVDSTRDRTLDMQCTVTRPGVSAMAGALAVELLVSLVHHPKHKYAQASILSSSSDGSNQKSAHVDVGGKTASDFGWVPHQIRGNLTNFQTYLMVGTAYNQCTACAEIVLKKYESEGFSFLLQVFNTPNILEELTGLKDLHEKTQRLFESIEEMDSEERSELNDDGFNLL